MGFIFSKNDNNRRPIVIKERRNIYNGGLSVRIGTIFRRKNKKY